MTARKVDPRSHQENVVAVCAKMYEARRTLRSLLGDDQYAARVADWKKLVRAVMEHRGEKNVFEVLPELIKSADGGGQVPWILAAAVELTEAEGD